MPLAIFYLNIYMNPLKNNTLKLILIIVFIIFISSYFISNSGYYEYEMQQRTIITNEKIKEFENDLANNENIDINNIPLILNIFLLP